MTRVDVPRGDPSRSRAVDDCRLTSIFYAVGDRCAGVHAIELALSMMKIARRLVEMCGEMATEVS